MKRFQLITLSLLLAVAMLFAQAASAEAGGRPGGIVFRGSGGMLSSHIGGRSGFSSRPMILPHTTPGHVGHHHGGHSSFGKHFGHGAGHFVHGGFGPGRHQHFPGCGHGPVHGFGHGFGHGRFHPHSGVSIILNFGAGSRVDHLGYYCTLCDLGWDSKLAYLEHLHLHHRIPYGYAASNLFWDDGSSVFFFRFD